jgi:hypothetical protein
MLARRHVATKTEYINIFFFDTAVQLYLHHDGSALASGSIRHEVKGDVNVNGLGG